MKIQQIYTRSPLRNFTYLISDPNGEAYCLDPFYAPQVMEQLSENGLKLKAIINTHEHRDHICGNDELQQSTNCEIWAHKNAQGKIPNVTRFLNKEEVIELRGGWTFKVMDTPGHTFAHLCLLLSEGPRAHAVFTGDTLFNAGVGNCHNGGRPETLYQTIAEQFQDMDDDVFVYPGHDYLQNNLGFTLDREPNNKVAGELKENLSSIDENEEFLVTNMKLEREINCFLRLNSKEIKQKLIDEGRAQNIGVSEKSVFLTLREIRNRW